MTTMVADYKAAIQYVTPGMRGYCWTLAGQQALATQPVADWHNPGKKMTQLIRTINRKYPINWTINRTISHYLSH